MSSVSKVNLRSSVIRVSVRESLLKTLHDNSHVCVRMYVHVHVESSHVSCGKLHSISIPLLKVCCTSLGQL